MIITSLNGTNYIFTFKSTDNPWDKLHNTIPLPDGPASLFGEDVYNNTSLSDFDDTHHTNKGNPR